MPDISKFTVPVDGTPTECDLIKSKHAISSARCRDIESMDYLNLSDEEKNNGTLYFVRVDDSTASDTGVVEVEEEFTTGLKIKSLPSKTYYSSSTTYIFDSTGISAVLIGDDGSERDVTNELSFYVGIPDGSILPHGPAGTFKTHEVGVCYIQTYSPYKTYVASFNIMIEGHGSGTPMRPSTIKPYIKVTQPPTQTIYSYQNGYEFKSEGLVVKYVNKFGEEFTVTKQCNVHMDDDTILFVTKDMIEDGNPYYTWPITVKYLLDGVRHLTSFNIYVYPNDVTPTGNEPSQGEEEEQTTDYIEVTTKPTKWIYNGWLNETFSSEGIVVQHHATDGTTTDVTENCTFSLAEGKSLKSVRPEYWYSKFFSMQTFPIGFPSGLKLFNGNDASYFYDAVTVNVTAKLASNSYKTSFNIIIQHPLLASWSQKGFMFFRHDTETGYNFDPRKLRPMFMYVDSNGDAAVTNLHPLNDVTYQVHYHVNSDFPAGTSEALTNISNGATLLHPTTATPPDIQMSFDIVAKYTGPDGTVYGLPMAGYCVNYVIPNKPDGWNDPYAVWNRETDTPVI